LKLKKKQDKDKHGKKKRESTSSVQ